MNLFITPLATDRGTLEPYPSPILFPNISSPPPAEAQRGDQEQEDTADRRSNGNEDRLVSLKPTGETAVALLDIWRTGGSEVIQKGLATGRVDTLQSDLDKVVVSLNHFCGWEELDVWIGDLVCLAVDKVTEINEHVGVPEEGHSQNHVIIGVGSCPGLE